MHVPCLNERKEDIPLLAQHFLTIFNEKYKQNKIFTIDTAAYLASLRYDGNVRQLRNLIERVTLLSSKAAIDIDEINAVYYMREYMEPTAPHRTSGTFKELMEKKEVEILRACWKQHQNTYKLAKALAISQPTVSRKLKKYGITDGDGEGRLGSGNC